MTKNTLLSLAGLAIIVGLFFVFKPSSKNNASAQNEVKSYNFTLQGKSLTAGPSTITVNEGDQVQITLTADKDWPELHLHGYEIKQAIKANVPTVESFKADKTGSFKIEVHFVEKKDSAGAADDTTAPSADPDELTLSTLQVQPKN